jgi:hypothetical protein
MPNTYRLLGETSKLEIPRLKEGELKVDPNVRVTELEELRTFLQSQRGQTLSYDAESRSFHVRNIH